MMAKKQFKAESRRLLDLMINSIYTHQEIFLREIISNASDAMDKLAYTALTDDKISVDRDQLKITITCGEGELTVSDRGIGMTKEELEENLGTIAKSGSLGFKQDMEKTEDIDIIGQFGVGFYAAFMVASKVTVSTDVIMTLKADTEEENYSKFLEEYEIRSLVKKYSDYIRYPICMDVTRSRKVEDTDRYEEYTEHVTLNSMVPLWQRAKKDVTEEEYQSFYREKFFDYNKPARVIHYSAEGNVSFKALLFVPGKAPFDFNTRDYKRGLQLYSSGVMIMEHCEDLIPECFSFVKGVVDSQDLSLNISREMLQHDRQLTVIAKGIEKKIKSELSSMLKDEREKYEEFYATFGRQLKIGVVADYGTKKELVQDLLLFTSHKDGKLITLGEYVDAMAEGQERIYYVPGQSKDRLSKLPQVQLLQKKGYDVLLFTDEVDEFVAQSLMTYKDKKLCNALTEDLGLQSEEEKKALEEKTEELKGFLTFVKETLGDAVKEVKLSAELGSAPAAITSATGMSFEMEKYMKRMNPEFDFPTERILELNTDHEAVKALQSTMTADPVLAKDYAQLLYSQALLLAELPLEDPAAYTELVCKLLMK